MDFLEALKDIKKDMQDDLKKQQKIDFEKESIAHREKRLKDEFLEYIKFADIKKIGNL